MIYEFRTYDLKVRSVPQVLENFAEVIEKRQELSKLCAFWYTEIGPLNQIIHVWEYKDAAERDKIRSEAVKHDWCPHKIGKFVIRQTVEIF